MVHAVVQSMFINNNIGELDVHFQMCITRWCEKTEFSLVFHLPFNIAIILQKRLDCLFVHKKYTTFTQGV